LSAPSGGAVVAHIPESGFAAGASAKALPLTYCATERRCSAVSVAPCVRMEPVSSDATTASGVRARNDSSAGALVASGLSWQAAHCSA
jgi:hypothetical protein